MKLFLLYRSGCLALQGLSCKLDFPLHGALKSRNPRYCYKLGNPPIRGISVPPASSPLAGGCVRATRPSGVRQSKAGRCSTVWVLWNSGFGPDEAVGKES